MPITYPGTIDTFTNPAGTTILDGPTASGHAGQHSDANDAIHALELVSGTTAGTSVLKNFAAGDFAARINSSNVLQQRVSGTVDNATLGTPSISAGTIANAQLIGTSQFTGGTITSAVLGTNTITGGTISMSVGTLNNMIMGSPSVTGGTIANMQLIGTSQHTGGTVTSAVLGTNTITGGTISMSVGTLNNMVMGSPSITGGTIANMQLIGTTQHTGGTFSSGLLGTNTITGGTISISAGTLSTVIVNNSTVGTPAITGGTATSTVLNTNVIGTPAITGGTATSTVLNSNTLGTPTIVLGSDAAGDVFFRSAGGTVDRLAVGGTGQVLTISAGTLPSWANPTGGGGGVGTVAALGPDLSGGTITTTGTISLAGTISQKTFTSPLVQGTWDGWISANETWTYASASTITVPSGAASKYQKGDRIKWTQTTVKYGVIVAVADTLLTIAVNTDYTVANAAISANYYSHEVNPVAFPAYFNYALTVTNFTIGNGSVLHAWYMIVNNVVHVSIEMSMGSTSSISGQLKPSLPVTSITYNADVTQLPGSGWGRDVGVAMYELGVVWSTSSLAALIAKGASGTYVTQVATSSTVPFTWGNTDQFGAEFSYQY